MTTATKPGTRGTESGDRREALLDAAIGVLAEQGTRGLTHRAVEAAAGRPHGSTTYYFGTRHELLIAVMAHIVERGRSAVEPIARQLTLQLADRSKPVDLDAIGDALISFIDEFGAIELVRYEMQVTGARDPEMKALMTGACDVFRDICEPVVIACGSKDPGGDARIVQAAVDGWMFSRLTTTDPDDETIRRGIRILLSAIADE